MPRELVVQLAHFLSQGKTGHTKLNIKDGRILAWEITELGRVDKPNSSGLS